MEELEKAIKTLGDNAWDNFMHNLLTDSDCHMFFGERSELRRIERVYFCIGVPDDDDDDDDDKGNYGVIVVEKNKLLEKGVEGILYVE